MSNKRVYYRCQFQFNNVTAMRNQPDIFNSLSLAQSFDPTFELNVYCIRG